MNDSRAACVSSSAANSFSSAVTLALPLFAFARLTCRPWFLLFPPMNTNFDFKSELFDWKKSRSLQVLGNPWKVEARGCSIYF